MEHNVTSFLFFFPFLFFSKFLTKTFLKNVPDNTSPAFPSLSSPSSPLSALPVNDIALKKGEKVYVIRRSVSGWWEGRKESEKEDTEEVGLFPSNHVRILKGVYAYVMVEQTMVRVTQPSTSSSVASSSSSSSSSNSSTASTADTNQDPSSSSSNSIKKKTSLLSKTKLDDELSNDDSTDGNDAGDTKSGSNSRKSTSVSSRMSTSESIDSAELQTLRRNPFLFSFILLLFRFFWFLFSIQCHKY
eukprot:TRINITY_DN863_c0_g1_i2.p1 TRINITY_DN863_c0_g1~~TRINITY_DN863_c0_g1_i2.p1  ORF type:complete len:245 (+),score=25.76 TRINITY_DN863_c0_g1_i2:296-1030(+)